MKRGPQIATQTGDFWNRWWNREISTTDGVDGWDAQSAYLIGIVKILKDRGLFRNIKRTRRI
jgi:hypothetical protein